MVQTVINVLWVLETGLIIWGAWVIWSAEKSNPYTEELKPWFEEEPNAKKNTAKKKAAAGGKASPKKAPAKAKKATQARTKVGRPARKTS